MQKDVSEMSTQERVELLGPVEGAKPVPKKERTYTVIPAISKEGASFYLAQLALKEEANKKGEDYKVLPTPREFVLKTQSFKENRPEKKKRPLNFTRDMIRCSKKNRNRAKIA